MELQAAPRVSMQRSMHGFSVKFIKPPDSPVINDIPHPQYLTWNAYSEPTHQTLGVVGPGLGFQAWQTKVANTPRVTQRGSGNR